MLHPEAHISKLLRYGLRYRYPSAAEGPTLSASGPTAPQSALIASGAKLRADKDMDILDTKVSRW